MKDELKKVSKKIYRKRWFISACLCFIIFFLIFLFVTLRQPILISNIKDIHEKNNFDVIKFSNKSILEDINYEYWCVFTNKINGKYLRPSSEISCFFECNSSESVFSHPRFWIITPSGENREIFDKENLKCKDNAGDIGDLFFGEKGNFELIISIFFTDDNNDYLYIDNHYSLTTYEDAEYSYALNQRNTIIIAILSLMLTIFVSFKYMRDLWED